MLRSKTGRVKSIRATTSRQRQIGKDVHGQSSGPDNESPIQHIGFVFEIVSQGAGLDLDRSFARSESLTTLQRYRSRRLSGHDTGNREFPGVNSDETITDETPRAQALAMRAGGKKAAKKAGRKAVPKKAGRKAAVKKAAPKKAAAKKAGRKAAVKKAGRKVAPKKAARKVAAKKAGRKAAPKKAGRKVAMKKAAPKKAAPKKAGRKAAVKKVAKKAPRKMRKKSAAPAPMPESSESDSSGS
jgi:hypothetical protein